MWLITAPSPGRRGALGRRSLDGHALGNRDLHLRARKGGELLAKGDVAVVPRGHDGDPRRPAAYAQLALPFSNVPANPSKPLATAGVAVLEATDAPDDGLLEGHRVVPPVAEALAGGQVRALQRLPEADAGVA